MGETESGENTYSIRPNFQHKFKSAPVKDCIRSVLKEELSDKQYVPEEVPQLTRFLSETIKDRLKDMGFDRYKMVVQVVIGEQRGEGVKMAARCFWDADTDNYAEDVFMNVRKTFYYFVFISMHLYVLSLMGGYSHSAAMFKAFRSY
ncbi:hypothetical protein XENTR_v10014400 [Xenopus tropicalis]|nr:hypothetical protein XENTR_v10014400 [Xenopus tropicalis]